ncbi:hypothetical protein SLA2020_370910 [Shorea laevis]
MNALFPATWVPYSLKPKELLPPLERKRPNSIFNFSSNVATRYPQLKTESCSVSGISTAEETLLLHEDWPQLLKFSIESEDFLLGQAVHAFLVKFGSGNDAFQGNNLVNFYAKFERLDYAHKVFDEMLVRNTITWTTLIKGHLENEDFEAAFGIARDMYWCGEKFNEHTCSVLLRACNSPEDRSRGEQIHGFVVKSGLEENVFVGTTLISMYSRSGHLNEAEKVFDGIASKDLQCLNYMILEYGNAGCGRKAFQVFIHMLSSDLEPNEYTFTNVIKACCEDLDLEEGRQLQGLAVKYGFMSVTSVRNALITMYGRHGMVEEAEIIFHSMADRNLITWTALISGYVRSGAGNEAANKFLEFIDLGIDYDSSCLATVLDGCSECKNLDFGLQIHGFAVKLGYLWDIHIGTALVDLYAKCGNLKSAMIVFNSLSNKTVALFNAILVGFMETNQDNEEDAMLLFSRLRLADMKPDLVTFSRLISLSAKQACLAKGKSLHAYTIKAGFETDMTVSNALITMYAKCASFEGAFQMFNSMNCHDSVSWNSILSTCAIHGHGEKALLLFDMMKGEGFAPDKITILAILQACSYSGLWEDGLCIFSEMVSKYGIKPVMVHFASVVDLLGRAGCLSEALDFINKCPFSDSPLLWRTLVSSCKLHGDLDIGKLASKNLLDLAPEEAESYILVTNMYAGSGFLDEAAKVRTAMNELKLSKEAGCSWIEIDNEVHHFVASDRDHAESREICATLDLLRDEMKWKNSNAIDLLVETV